MRKIVAILYFALSALIFSGCSNVEMGFDEDSIFYTKKSQVKESQLKSEHVQKKQEESKKVEPQEEEQENETIIYYERDDGE